MELVSVVVGTYNGSKYIKEQLQSIIDQTYPSLEIVIVDDASKDTTVDIITEYAEKHANISVYPFDENVGYIKNFERGMELATGEFIALSDQDDWWEPSKIEKLTHAMDQSDLVYCDSIFVDEKLQELGNSFSSTKNLISANSPLNLLIDNCVSGHASLFRKSLFHKAKPFPDKVPHDWWLAYVATFDKGIYYLDEPLVKYRHHQNNVIVSSNRVKKSKSQKFEERRLRVDSFYKKCPHRLSEEKKIMASILHSYRNFSIVNNMKRVRLFFINRKEILRVLKRNKFNRMVFILNMFFRVK